MEKIRLFRDDQKDLVFTGEIFASESTKTTEGDGQNRYTEYTLYLTEKGKVIFHKQYITRWQGESGTSTAEAFENHEAAIEWIVSEYCDGCFPDAIRNLFYEAAAAGYEIYGKHYEEVVE